MFVPVIKPIYLYLKHYVSKLCQRYFLVVKPTRYKEIPKDLETTSVTVLFMHTTTACRAVDDDEDDEAQRQEPPPPKKN